MHRKNLNRILPRLFHGRGQAVLVLSRLLKPRQEPRKVTDAAGRQHKPAGGGGVLLGGGTIRPGIDHGVNTRGSRRVVGGHIVKSIKMHPGCITIRAFVGCQLNVEHHDPLNLVQQSPQILSGELPQILQLSHKRPQTRQPLSTQTAAVR